MKRCNGLFVVISLCASLMVCLSLGLLIPRKCVAADEKAAKSSKAVPSWQAKWDNTLAAARKEGKVTVVTFVGAETRNALSQAFKAKYGIDLDFTVGQAAATLTKIQAERSAGLYSADAVINGSSAISQLFKKNGLLDPLASALILPEVTDPKMWYGNKTPYFDKEGTGIGFLSQYNSCVLRNTELVKEGEITSFHDFLKPQWKEKVVMYDPSISGSGQQFLATLAEAWNVEEVSTWLRRMLKEQNLNLSRDPRLQVEWVARGKYPLALAVYTDQLVNFLVSGAPIAQLKVKEGGFVTSSTGCLGLFNKPAHPNAAIVFVNWLLSREGQIAFTSGFGGPSNRRDVKATGVYASLTPLPGDKYFLEDEEGMLKRIELTKTWAKIVAEK